MTDPSGTVFTPEEIAASQEFLASPAFKTLSVMQERRDEAHRQQMADTNALIAALSSKVATLATATPTTTSTPSTSSSRFSLETAFYSPTWDFTDKWDASKEGLED